MLRFLLPVLLSQAPPAQGTNGAPPSAADDVAIVSVSQPATLEPLVESELLAVVRAALDEAGLRVQDPARTRAASGSERPEACGANVTCLVLFGRLAGVPVMVRVEAAVLETDFAIVLHAFSSANGNLLAQRNFLTNTTQDWRADARKEALGFGAELKPQLPAAPPEPIVTTPPPAIDVREAATPPPAPAPPAVVARSGAGALFWAPLAVGVASTAASAVFFTRAGAIHDELTTPPRSSEDTLPLSTADARVAEGKNAQLLSRVTLGVGLAGLAVAGGVLLLSRGDEPATAVSITPTRDGAFVSVSARFP